MALSRKQRDVLDLATGVLSLFVIGAAALLSFGVVIALFMLGFTLLWKALVIWL